MEGGWEREEPAPFLPWLKELLGFWSACSNAPSWEGSLMSLLARLAADNIGCIDWTEECPVFYQKFMQSFKLPVYYKRLAVGLKECSLTNAAIAKWIVSSISKVRP